MSSHALPYLLPFVSLEGLEFQIHVEAEVHRQLLLCRSVSSSVQAARRQGIHFFNGSQ